MIAFLKGDIKDISEKYIVILVNNIGWLVNVYSTQVYELNIQVELYIYTHIREDEISLWGFKNINELKLFKLLIGVSGIGPKIAQALLDQKGIPDIILSIKSNDHKNLKVSGVGDKTSQKIIIELKNKIGDFEEYISIDKEKNKSLLVDINIYNETVEALMSLGYKKSDIIESLELVLKINNDYKRSEDLIKILLTKL